MRITRTACHAYVKAMPTANRRILIMEIKPMSSLFSIRFPSARRNPTHIHCRIRIAEKVLMLSRNSIIARFKSLRTEVAFNWAGRVEKVKGSYRIYYTRLAALQPRPKEPRLVFAGVSIRGERKRAAAIRTDERTNGFRHLLCSAPRPQ